MGRDWVLKIIYLESVDSTQKYLKNLLQSNTIKAPIAVSAMTQTNGMGSRNNEWISFRGNLFLSFALPLQHLPNDLKLASASIYFAYLLKEVFTENGSKVWLKWPNDFYIGKQKVGGMITSVVKDTLICGVGINLQKAPEGFATLDIKISHQKLLHLFFTKIEKKILWKQVFSKYKLEFYKNRDFFIHNGDKKILCSDVLLEGDGSIISNGERIYSLR